MKFEMTLLGDILIRREMNNVLDSIRDKHASFLLGEITDTNVYYCISTYPKEQFSKVLKWQVIEMLEELGYKVSEHDPSYNIIKIKLDIR